MPLLPCSRRPSPFEGYVEPALPADLPPTEAKRTEVMVLGGTPSPHPPQSAPGFTRAWELGLLPAPAPADPPAPVPGVRAQVLMWSGIALPFGSLLAMAGPLPDSASSWLVVCACWVAGFWLLGPATTRREETEFAAGYTTRDNYTGLWRLDRHGRVLRAPAPGVPPPGFYPSPYTPGLLQRWEGPGWALLPQHWRRHAHRYFARPDVPFL